MPLVAVIMPLCQLLFLNFFRYNGDNFLLAYVPVYFYHERGGLMETVPGDEWLQSCKQKFYPIVREKKV
jgi:hypothetical protein